MRFLNILTEDFYDLKFQIFTISNEKSLYKVEIMTFFYSYFLNHSLIILMPYFTKMIYFINRYSLISIIYFITFFSDNNNNNKIELC